MKIKIFLLLGIVLTFTVVNAQSYDELSGKLGGINVISTAVPFVAIGPDARAGGMGDGGVASSADANSMHWNPAKYAWVEDPYGVSVSYTPWLRNLVNDINLAHVSFFAKLSPMSTFAASLRYFSLGEINFTDNEGNSLGIYKPNEFALDATYARKLSDNFSLAVAGRFIYSDLTQGQTVQGQPSTAGISVAADLALYWQKDVEWFSTMDAQFAWGVNISNIGNKISYSNSNIQRDFIPTNLKFGPRLTLDLDDYNKISFQFDVNKLLVPTPPIYYPDSTASDGSRVIYEGKDPEVAVISGMIQSWYDAPNGFTEEMQEFSFSVGAEYWYNNIMALRGGYFYEDNLKGGRKYFTLGVGLRYNVFGLDFSYLIPATQTQQHPLQNTLRFSLLFRIGDAGKSSTAPKG